MKKNETMPVEEAEKLTTISVTASEEVWLAIWNEMVLKKLCGNLYSEADAFLVHLAQAHRDGRSEICLVKKKTKGKSKKKGG